VSSVFSVPELAIGIAVGGAAGAAFEPKLELPKQQAWQRNPQRIPDLGLLAELVAGGKITIQDGRTMAARLGFDQGPFDSVVWLAQNRLDFPMMLRLWRLFPKYVTPSGKSISQLVDETLAHEQLDWDYHDLLTKLEQAERPGIGDLAYSVVRGYLPTDINLPVPPPSTNDYVPRFPQSKTKAEDLAAQIGFEPAMLELMVARSGLSMAPVMAANALFRSNAAAAINGLPNVPNVSAYTGKPYVGPNDYLLAISEGDLRTEWAEAVKETARQLLTAGEYAELELRGYIDKPTRRALTEQHGMSHFDSDLLYDVLGRAPSIKQVYIGLARGGTYDGQPKTIPEPFLSAVQRANIRPEWYDIEYALRYSLPSAFVVRTLLKDGAIDATRASTIFQNEGWPPDLADLVANHYAASGTGTADPHTGKAQTQLWTTTHKSYVAQEITDAVATGALAAAGVPAATVPAILALWKEERSLIRKQLSPAQIKKAFTGGAINPVTGQAWTQAEATQALLDRGYDHNDATVLLTE
jgi:hypothetical protein